METSQKPNKLTPKQRELIITNDALFRKLLNLVKNFGKGLTLGETYEEEMIKSEILRNNVYQITEAYTKIFDFIHEMKLREIAGLKKRREIKEGKIEEEKESKVHLEELKKLRSSIKQKEEEIQQLNFAKFPKT